ncbi:uncharacterized protein N7500_008083 [Penicillium coprophilum]|uniref:uncharacterized protein n=1 Tax=Penicillium coprophilum TaxID=36646 RepID=UPI002386DC0A|nr:uncharacterized protein N7500_008083 [Penicillium coprophilum]KAJ5158432.1 hypothetical protein N7500_008083 [Penicillium coprophilum]
MCLFAPSSSLALISLTGFSANLDPSLLLDSPAPDISNVSTHLLTPFNLGFDFSASELTWLGVPDRYSQYLATILYDRARSIANPAVIAGAFTKTDRGVSLQSRNYHRR